MKHIEDAIFDLARDVALEVFGKKQEIIDQASEGLLDDDHEQVAMNVSDLIDEIIKERMNK